MEISENLKVNTPIVDFIGNYCETGNSRFHMPGHKGINVLGFEKYDITEICGADNLYHPEGIIKESEMNASKLFGSASTFYSTEGSSQCIKAMLKIVLDNYEGEGKPYILAARNVHKAFIYGVALLDLDVRFINSDNDSICSSNISSDMLREELDKTSVKPAAVYVTSPDYLGIMSDIEGLAKVCHQAEIPLLVDNAHGAYLHFLDTPLHPMDLGADMCCDSAHKTLPVITGGAYIHMAGRYKNVDEASVKEAMGLFGSTSPSYLTLASLDKCNEYLAGDYRYRINNTVQRIREIKEKYKLCVLKDLEPLKITISAKGEITGYKAGEILRNENVEFEYADEDYVVLMVTEQNSEEDFVRLMKAIEIIQTEMSQDEMKIEINDAARKQGNAPGDEKIHIPQVNLSISVREAILSHHESVRVEDSLGRICASPTVSCPPAIPIAISGQRITEVEIQLFRKYKIDMVEVVK